MLQWWSKAWGCQHCPPRWTKNLAALQINRMKTLGRVKCLPLVGQVPQDLWLKAKGGMQRTKIAENKLGFNFFLSRMGTTTPFRNPFLLPPLELPGRAAAGAELAELELPQSAQQLRLDNSSEPCWTVGALRGLPLCKQLCMPRQVPWLQIKPCTAHSDTRRDFNL